MDNYEAFRGGESPSQQPATGGTAQPTIEPPSITYALIALNVLIFLVMVFKGVSFFSPNAQSVLAWGADYGPYTLGGQWWRMFTSMFLHFGIIHIAFNMLVLANIGPFMEALSGRVSYSILYIVSGLGGGVASLVWHPTTISAGASGAIFGLYGALLGFLVVHRNIIDPEALKSLRKGALTFVGYNILFGLTPGIDMAAHMGGLCAGFLLGLFLVQPRAKSKSSLNTRNAAAILLGASLLLLPLRTIPKPGDIIGELSRMRAAEDASLKLYNDSLGKWKAQQLSAAQFADILDKQILPKWKTEREALARLQHLPASQAKLTTSLIKYMDAREDSWQFLVEGLRTGDAQKIKQSVEKNHEADQLAGKIGGGK